MFDGLSESFDFKQAGAHGVEAENLVHSIGTEQAWLKEHANAPIGIFDSGVGGFGVLAECRKKMPSERFIYFADTLHMPLGCRTRDEIIEITFQGVRYLMERGVKCIVLACNTATGTSIENIRARVDIPIIGVEPAILPAISQIHSGQILVLGTPATLVQPKFIHLLERVQQNRLILQAEATLASTVERLLLVSKSQRENTSIEARAVVRDLLSHYQCLSYNSRQSMNEEVLKAGERIPLANCTNNSLSFSKPIISGIVLGCTHYSLLRPMWEEESGIAVFDGNRGTAKNLYHILLAGHGLNLQNRVGKVEIITTCKDALVKRKYREICARVAP